VCSPRRFTRPGALTITAGALAKADRNSELASFAGDRGLTDGFSRGGIVGYCVRRLGVIAGLLAPAAMWAQLPPVGVPRGVVRVELDGALESFDHRWLDGERQGYGADVSSPALGSNLIPALADAEARLARITGLADYHLNLGSLSTDAQGDVSRADLGLSLGLTRSITIFGRLPVVRARVQKSITLDPTGGDAGVNPGATQEASFFSQFDAAVIELDAAIGRGDYDANPGRKALAQSTLADATALRDDLFGLLSDPSTAAGFVPTSSSTAGLALLARIAALQGTLDTDLGVTGFTLAPTLAAASATSDDLIRFVSDPAGPIALRTGDSTVTFRGDAETGLALTLADRWDRSGKPGGFRAAIEGLVRYPTGVRARSDRLLTLGTGDGQTDVEARITADLGSGRWGARLVGDYNRQLAADLADRVASPSQPFPDTTLLSNVHFDPGDDLSLTVRPFFRLAPSFAIIGTVQRWTRSADKVSYLSTADEIPGVDASVLAEPKRSATLVGIGLTYSNPGRLRGQGRGLPVDAGWSYERIASASGGRVADVNRVRASLRVYFGVW
jgi:hypothetical protein